MPRSVTSFARLASRLSSVGRDILSVAAWVALKAMSSVLFLILKKNPKTERMIIKFGNHLFKRSYPLEMFCNFASYIRLYPVDLQTYLTLLPGETWLVNRKILDIGSGLGAYSYSLKQKGARTVVAVEVQFEKALFSCIQFPGVFGILTASADSLPFQSETFDTVFSHTVFEHISDVITALQNVRRVLKRGGVALLSYNFFHSRGGHHLFPFIHFPWPTWIVSEKTLCEYWSACVAEQQAEGGMGLYRPGFRIQSLSEGEEIHLNRLNFEQFERYVEWVGLRIVKRKTTEVLGRLFPPLTKVPGLKYAMCGTIFYVLTKQ